MPSTYNKKRGKIRPRKVSSSSIFSTRSFDFKTNRFIKLSLIGTIVIIVVIVSLI